MRIDQDQDKIISFINDIGPGIDSYLQHTSGSDLGLRIAYMIAKLHAGNIQVESKKEGGATFKVTLPLSN